LDRDVVVRAEGALVYAVADASRVDALLDPSSGLDASTDAGPIEIELARGLWDHVRRNGAQICEDFRTLSAYGETPRRIFATRFAESSPRAARLVRTRYGGAELGVVHPGVHLIEPDSILFGEDCQVRPGVVLDASEGPIVLGSGVEVHSMSVVVGPCSLGPGTLVQPGTRLREGTSVGAFCKVGGEVEDSILLDLSNKQHDGFLGHAYVGQWVNLGADTNGSDLKNNYAPVRVDFGTRQIDTGETFVGPLLGDHVKTSINTMLNTGSVVGTGSNLFGADFPPRFVPPFAWGGADAMVEYRLDRALQTARAVLARREVEWTAAYQTLLEELFASTAPLREGRAPRAS
jgi:UDP-N-acetylglucosamine diphosphorylase/glucosamine-1-phosphate N-acetyltransferase